MTTTELFPAPAKFATLKPGQWFTGWLAKGGAPFLGMVCSLEGGHPMILKVTSDEAPNQVLGELIPYGQIREQVVPLDPGAVTLRAGYVEADGELGFYPARIHDRLTPLSRGMILEAANGKAMVAEDDDSIYQVSLATGDAAHLDRVPYTAVYRAYTVHARRGGADYRLGVYDSKPQQAREAA